MFNLDDWDISLKLIPHEGVNVYVINMFRHDSNNCYTVQLQTH